LRAQGGQQTLLFYEATGLAQRVGTADLQQLGELSGCILFAEAAQTLQTLGL
jgi:hypothetical protein